MSQSLDKPQFRLGQTAETPLALTKGSVPLNVSKSVSMATPMPTEIPTQSNELTQTAAEQTMVT